MTEQKKRECTLCDYHMPANGNMGKHLHDVHDMGTGKVFQLSSGEPEEPKQPTVKYTEEQLLYQLRSRNIRDIISF